MKKILIISFLSIILTACSKLDQQPISDLSNEQFWRTAEHATLGLAGVYDGVQRTLNGNYTEWGDARSDNFTFSGTAENQINVAFNALNSLMAAANWNTLYTTIGRCNAAIKYLPRINDLSVVNRNHFMAQALAVRAYMYFYAVRNWGDVPVRLEPYEDPTQDASVAKTPAATVIDSTIIADLNRALTLVNRNASANVWEVSIGGILAMLTEVHLWKKDYPRVISTTDQLIALNRYSLASTATYKNVFVDNNTAENIWSLHWNYLNDGGNGIARIGSSSNTSNYVIDSVVLMQWETNKVDLRRSINYDTTQANGNIRIEKLWKFYPQIDPLRPPVLPPNNQNEAKLPLYRWADILLMRAEALNWISFANRTAVFTLVNQVRTRVRAASLVAANYPTQADVENAVLNERQLELFSEGKRWFDLVRTGKVLTIMDPLIRERQRKLLVTITGFTDPRKILWPIHREALVRNTLLVQNPPYSE